MASEGQSLSSSINGIKIEFAIFETKEDYLITVNFLINLSTNLPMW